MLLYIILYNFGAKELINNTTTSKREANSISLYVLKNYYKYLNNKEEIIVFHVRYSVRFLERGLILKVLRKDLRKSFGFKKR